MRLPILRWLPQYDAKEWLLDDISAGLTTFVYLVPQAMAYATIVGLPAVYGLYSSVLPLLLYAVLGTSRQLSMAPMAISSLLLGAAVKKFHFSDESPELIAAALSVTLVTGIIQLLMGLCRMGALANFISPSVLLGFLTASGLTIGVVQLKDILGIAVPRFPRLYQTALYTLQHLHEAQLAPVLLGGSAWVLLYAVREWRKREALRHKEQDAAAIADAAPQSSRGSSGHSRVNSDDPSCGGFQCCGLVCRTDSIIRSLAQLANFFAVIVGSAIAAVLVRNGVALHVVGPVPSGFSAPALHSITGEELVSVIPAAVSLAFVTFAGNWSLCKKYAELHQYEVDASQELIAYGVAVIGGVLSNSFMVAGGLGRTVVNADAGARTQLSGVITASLVALSLLLFTGGFYYIPLCVLSAIIEVSLASMVDFPAFGRIYRSNRRDFAVVMGTFAATLLIGEAEGLLLGIVLDVCVVLYALAFPAMSVLGQVRIQSAAVAKSAAFAGSNQSDEAASVRGTMNRSICGERYPAGVCEYADIAKHPLAKQIPGVAIVRVEGNPFYANCNYVKDFIAAAAAGEHSRHGTLIERVVVDCSAWTYLDTAAVDMLMKLQTMLAQRPNGGVALVFCAVRDGVIAALQRLREACYNEDVFCLVSEDAAIAEEGGAQYNGTTAAGQHIPSSSSSSSCCGHFIAESIDAAIALHLKRAALRGVADREMVALARDQTLVTSPAVTATAPSTGVDCDTNSSNSSIDSFRSTDDAVASPFHSKSHRQYTLVDNSEHGDCAYRQMSDEHKNATNSV